MDRFLLADNPRTNRGLSIIHMLDPIAIILVEDEHIISSKHYEHCIHAATGEKFTLIIHHMFTTNMAGMDDNIGENMVKKLLQRAWHWFDDFLKWEDEQNIREQ